MDRFFNRLMPRSFESWPGLAWSDDGETKFEWSPSADIGETEKEYLARAELPAVKKKDVKVTDIGTAGSTLLVLPTQVYAELYLQDPRGFSRVPVWRTLKYYCIRGGEWVTSGLASVPEQDSVFAVKSEPTAASITIMPGSFALTTASARRFGV